LGTEYKVLFRASISQIHVPYETGSPRFHDLTTSIDGLGNNAQILAGGECPGGALYDGNRICKQFEDRGYAWKNGPAYQRGQVVSVFMSSQLGRYNYVNQWNFQDDGVIEPKLGLTGRLQVIGSGAGYLPYGQRLDPESGAVPVVGSDGITEELLNGLARVEGLRVPSRTSAFSFKGKQEDVREIARKLGVSTVLEGSVRRAGQRLRINAQLIDAANGDRLWSETYDRDVRDVLAVEEEMARTIVAALKLKLGSTPSAPSIIKRSTTSVEAYNLYLQGRYFWSFRPDRKLEAKKYFEQAIQLDPKFSEAHAGLADWYATLGSWEDGRVAPSEAMPKAKEEAERALQIDRTLAAPHNALAYVKLHYDRDYVGSEREFKEAVRLDPGYPMAHHWYSHLLTALSRRDESLRESKLFLELDVLSSLPPIHLAWHYFMAHQYRESLQALEKTIELDPHYYWIPFFQGLAHERLGQTQLAIEEFKAAGKSLSGLTFVIAGLGYTYATNGQRDEAQKLLDELKALAKQKYVPSYDIALIYVGLGENDQAFEWLQKAEDEHSGWMVYSKLEPRLESLSKDPRYDAMLHRLGLDR